MKTVLIIRHVYFEDLGILALELRTQGYQITYLDAPLADFRQYAPLDFDLLIVLGGPIGVFDEAQYPFIADELLFIEKRLNADKPILGICLGAQLIARLLGSRVYPMLDKEIGFSPLSLTLEGKRSVLASLENQPVLHWHGDQFDIPNGAIHLAKSECCPNQAFSYGHSVLALQFHMEADLRQIESWLVGHACELAQAQMDPVSLRLAATQNDAILSPLACSVFRLWLEELPVKA